MIKDEALRAALEEVDNAILASLPKPSECEHQFSARFEKRMRKVRRRAKHPTVYKVLRQVACFLLAILILFSSVMVFSSEARAAVVDWIKEQFESFCHYFFVGGSSSESGERTEYELGWVPDGYTHISSQTVENRVSKVYLNNNGQIIQFSYLYGSDSNPLFMDSDHFEYKSVTLSFGSADLFIALTEGETSSIVWSDGNQGILFCIAADLQEQELIALAEGIKEI